MDPGEFESVLYDSELILDRLRALYEQYFQGVERLEPTVPRKDLDRKLDQLRRSVPRNTALRFRYHMLVQKYTTYQTYWRRITRQIEEGTYRRDLMKARQKRETARRTWESRIRDDGYELDVDVEVDLDGAGDGAGSGLTKKSEQVYADDEVTAALKALEPVQSVAPRAQTNATTLSPFALPSRRPGPSSEAPAAPDPAPREPPSKTFKRPAAAAVAAPRAAAQPAPRAATAVDEGQLRRVYERFVDARRKNNEPVDNIRFETMRKSVEKMLPKLREKHKGKEIDFEVVVRDGKVGLKPVPR